MPSIFTLKLAAELAWKIISWGDFPTTEEELAGIAKFEALNNPEPEPIKTPTENVALDFEPTIEKTTTNIVNVYNQPTTINIFSNNSVAFPKSNLPIADSEEQSGQTPTKISIGSPITLGISALEQDYGKFVYSPISPEPKEIQRVISSEFADLFKQEILNSMEKYLTSKAEGITLEPFDSISYILPSVMRGNRGKLTLVIGARPLRMLSQYYSATRANAAIGILDEIPSQITFTNKEISFSLETENKENLVLNSLLTKENSIGNLLDSEFDWTQKIKEFADKQIDSETKEPVAVQSNSLSELILNLFAVYYNKIGLDAFPNTVPETMTQALYDSSGNALEPKTIDNLSVMDFLIWQFKVMDELIGRFPIDIQIEDTDLIKVGDQPIKVSMPNIAETLAELAGKSIFTEAKIDSLLPIVLKNIAETGSCRQQVLKNYYLAIAMQEYLGFSTKQKIKEMDLSFNPNIAVENDIEKTLANALEPSSIKVQIEENNDKNTLEGQVSTLIETARILKATHWQSLKATGDVKQQIIDKLKNQRDILKKKDVDKSEDFNFFIQCFEQGFEDFLPGGNPDKPFGKPFKNRPKVRKYDTNGKSNTPTKPSL